MVSGAALVFAWEGQQRVRALEQELVRRQQDSGNEAAEARLWAKQALEVSREAVAKASLLEARVAEVALQRSQVEELMQALSRSRDENLLADIDAAVRVALQQSGITGSAAPLVAALKQSEERLARVNQPRLDSVRRAIVRDLDRVRSTGNVELGSLAIKLDDAVRLVDEAPLVAFEAPRPDARNPRAAGPLPAAARGGSSGMPDGPARAASATAGAALPDWLPSDMAGWWRGVWFETRELLRVSRVDRPEAMLLAPEQSFFLRENLKLRLLNARLAVLSRQFDIAQTDLQAALATVDVYFERTARKTGLLAELLRSVAQQARQGGVPRPDDTLAALAAAAAGR